MTSSSNSSSNHHHGSSGNKSERHGSAGNSSSYPIQLVSSSSSEKVYNVNKPSGNSGAGSGNHSLSGSGSKSSFGIIESVKEKIDNVRGRRRSSKEPLERGGEVLIYMLA